MKLTLRRIKLYQIESIVHWREAQNRDTIGMKTKSLHSSLRSKACFCSNAGLKMRNFVARQSGIQLIPETKANISTIIRTFECCYPP